MKTINLGKTGLKIPAVALGCMRITELDRSEVPGYLYHALELGINFFDHADIYGRGECERIFAEGLTQLDIPRESIILQSKCGIVPGKMYDLSYKYIIASVEGILRRLNTEYLDILLMHRPDALVEPEEVAKAFDDLHNSGKVRYFGVSNHRPLQIELLKKYVSQEICIDQMQLSLPFSSMISEGLEVNMQTDGAVDRSGSILDYCRVNDMTMQVWSPFQGKNGTFIDDNNTYPDLNWRLGELAAKYNTSKTAVAASWLLRHPAGVQLIAGTMNKQRLSDIASAADISLTREEWYSMYLSAGHILP